VAALQAAAVKASDIDYVEAHGTGTILGDPIEAASLTRAFRRSTDGVGFCRLGSVKPNVGHLDRAAGVASLIKVVKSLEQGVIPASINFDKPNPEIDFARSPFVVNTTLTPWSRGKRPRRAGVNSLGMGGTNAHVIVEEAPEQETEAEEVGLEVLVLSARTATALEAQTRQMSEYLREKPGVRLGDVAHTLQVGRKAWEYRRAVVCGTVEEAAAALETPEGMWSGRAAEDAGPRVSIEWARRELRWEGGGGESERWEAADERTLLEEVGRRWVRGAEIRWDGRRSRRRIALPTYPFERKRYWIESPARGSGAGTTVGLLADEAPKTADLADWFYVPSWKRSWAGETGGGGSGTWLVAGDGKRVALVGAALQARGVAVVKVEEGSAFEEVSASHYVVRPGEQADYAGVLKALREQGATVSEVVMLWLAEPAATWKSEVMTRGVEYGFYALMGLGQALGEQPGTRVRVTVVTSEAQEVISGETVCAVKTLATGPCRVLPQEMSHVRCRMVDVEAEPGASEQWAERVAGELCRETSDVVVALRGKDRWVQEVARVHLPPVAAGAALRPGGVYLITGGLGGVGQAIATHLARTVGARLILVGRKTAGSEAVIAALEGAGAAAVLVRAAEVSATAELEKVVIEAESRFGEIHGVIHAAGVAPSGLLQRKSRAQAEAVLRPKVFGTLALGEVFASRRLDFLCLFSSISSITGGGPGQVDYCAANAFLEGYAQENRERHGQTCAIGWGEWQWNGWAEGLDGFPAEAQRYFIEKRRAFGLSNEEGAEAFVRILGHGLPAAYVATQDLGQMVEGSKTFSVTTILEAVKRWRGPQARHPRPPLAVSYVAPARDAEQRLARIWSELLGFAEIGIHDNFFDLGGNSLLGVDLVARIGQEFSLATVPPHLLYEAPTVATLANALVGGERQDDTAADEWARRSEKRREKLRRLRPDSPTGSHVED
jgi:acyl transferase domain-containing protein